MLYEVNFKVRYWPKADIKNGVELSNLKVR